MNFFAQCGWGRAIVTGLVLLVYLVLVFVAAPAQAAVTFRSASSASAISGGVIAHVGAGTSNTRNNCGDITPSVPAGSVGDMLIAVVVARENGATVSMTGWNQYFTDSYPGQEFQTYIFWRVATGTDPNTITQSGTCSSFAGQIARFSGVDTTNPFETDPILAANWVRQNSNNIDTGTENTTSPAAMLLVAGFIMDNGTVTQGAGWSQSFDSSLNLTRDTAISLHYQLQTTAGAKSVSNWALSSGTDPNYGVIFALRPATTSTLTISKPAGTATADVMIASVSVTPSTVTITPPVGWTLVRQVTQGSVTSSKLATYYRVAGVGEPASFFWTFSGGSHSGVGGGIMSFSGVDNVTPIDAEAGNATASATTHTAPSITTTLDNGMLVTTHELTSSRTWTPPGGMTEAVDVASLTPSNASGIALEMNYEARATAGVTGTRTATVGGDADSGATQSVALKATPLVCYTDDFNRPDGAPGSDWVISNTSGTFGDPVIFNNRLRLTDATGNVATMATLQRLFPGSGNRIEMDFDHFAYGFAGCAADGIAVTLSDSGVTAVPGGYGGSLGYAQRTGINGFAGGWLGIGIDEYGNFSNPTEGRVGGPGFRVDSVSIRGSGSGSGTTYGAGLPNYAYHAGTATLTPQVDNNGAASPPHHYRIIVDHSNGVNAMVSVERDTGAGYVTLVAPYDAKAQTGQTTVPTGWLLSYTGSTGGCNNIHEIDSLQVCATTLTSLSGIHHFDIIVGASASTCASQSVTITAKDISDNVLTGYTGSVSITTSTAHGDWSVISAGGTFSNGTADDGVATYTFVAGDNGTITLDFANTHADDLTFNVTDITVPSTSTTSATTSFRDSAFVVTPDTIQIAGRDQNTTITLYTKVSGSCTADTSYTGARNLDAWLTLDPSHPAGATVPTIGALTLPASAPASNPASNNLSLTFTAGVASFALSTTDVGRYVLNIRDDTRIYATAVDLGGASSSITTRPWLHAAATGNPGSNTASGSIFTSAGTDFTATVRGVLWQAADDANDDGVPDSGANLADNAAAPRFAWDTVLSPTTPFTPAAGTLGTLVRGLGGSTVAQASFSSGSATVTDWRYSEVGSFTLRASASNYLNSGVTAQTDNGVVGRFTPAYFDVTRIHGCPAGADPLLFTYSGQPFTVTATARAANSGTTTANYDGTLGFAKDTTISDAGVTTNFTPNNNTTSNNVLGAGSFAGGARTQSTVTYTFPAKETAPATLTLRAIDADSVSSAGHTEEQTQIRSGRVRLYNAYGSELVTLSMPMRVEYYEDTTVSAPATNPPITGWVTNSADTCTSLSLPSLDLQNAVHDPAQGVATINIKTGPNIPSTVTVVSPTAGVGELSFSAPGAGGDGYADARMDLSARSWLQFDWNGTGNTDPTGRATFGLYRGSPKHIYLRQRYN